MKNRLTNITLTYGLDLILVLILVFFTIVFYRTSTNMAFFILFFVLLLISLLPISNFLHDVIDSTISPISYDELFVHTVDSILNIESFDEILKSTFDQLLDLLNIKTGLLVFYYHDRDEFNIFYQKNRKSRIIRKAKIENNNILFKVINGPEDIIQKSKLNDSIHFERRIVEEMEKLNGEVIIPVYYHDMFLGLIIIGHRKRRIPKGEMRLLKIFASRIAILSVNSFFFNELLKKKELEKEYEIASNIQSKFLPDEETRIGRIHVRVFHETVSLMKREFFDIFINDTLEDDVRISAYRLQGNITGTSIYMPCIQALLQSFSRLGYSPARGISKLKKIMREKYIMDEEISIFHSTISQSGEIHFSNSSYQTPLIYRKSANKIYPVKQKKKGQSTSIKIRQGDILIISCETFFNIIKENISKFSDILKNHSSASLKKIKSVILKNISSVANDDKKDKLLILLSIEDAK